MSVDGGTIVHVTKPKTSDCLKEWFDGGPQQTTVHSVVQVLGKVDLSSQVYCYDMIAFDERLPFVMKELAQILS